MNRLTAETITDRKCGPYMAIAEMTGTLGANAFLGDALSWALRALGFETAAPDTVTDDEVGQATGDYIDALLDLAELRALEMCQTRITHVDYRVGLIDEKTGQLAGRLKEIIPEKRKNIAARHGALLAAPLSDDAHRQAVFKAI